MGETRVDLLHLLEDLRDAYPGSLEETIVSEVVANALDSGARTVRFATDPVAATLTVTDDGAGWRAAISGGITTSRPAASSGGAASASRGVGIKLGLLVCQDVLTET